MKEETACIVFVTTNMFLAYGSLGLGAELINPTWGPLVGLLAAFGAEVLLFMFGALAFGVWSNWCEWRRSKKVRCK